MGDRIDIIFLVAPSRIHSVSFPGGIKSVFFFSFSVIFSVSSDNYILSAVLEFIPEHRTSQLILQPRGRQRQEVKMIFLSIKEIPTFKIQAQMMSFMWNHSGDRPAGRRDSKCPCSFMCPVSTWVNWSWRPRWQSVGWAGWHGLEPWAKAQPPYSQPWTWLKAWLRVNTQQTRAGLLPSPCLASLCLVAHAPAHLSPSSCSARPVCWLSFCLQKTPLGVFLLGSCRAYICCSPMSLPRVPSGSSSRSVLSSSITTQSSSHPWLLQHGTLMGFLHIFSPSPKSTW